MILITANWLSTYWLMIVLSFIFLITTYRLKYFVSMLTALGLLVSFIVVIENDLRKNYSLEIVKWGEFPVLRMDSVTVYSLIPNKTTHLRYNNYDYFVKTNSYGFTSPEINLNVKTDNEKRVLIIGDAFSMPEGVDYTSSYPYLLEQKLREYYPHYKINVIDAGVTGYGQNEKWAQLNKYIKIIKPDIVINQFFVNDYDDINILKEQRRSGIGFYFDKSFMNRYFGNAQIPMRLDLWAQKKMGIIDKSYLYNKSLLSFYKKNATYYDDTVINKVSKYFDEMKNLCLTSNSEYLVMYVPGQIEVSKPRDIAYYPYFEDMKDTTAFDFNRPQKVVVIYVQKKISIILTPQPI